MKTEILQQALTQREEEILHYQINIDNYTLLLQVLPTEWPEHLVYLKGADNNTIAASLTDLTDITLVSDLVFRDRIQALLTTETLEQRKAILVRDVIQQQLAA